VDWFTTLEAPTQVAIIGVVTAVIAAVAGVSVAVVNNRKAGGGKAEIAAMTMDASSIKQASAALEALNVTLTEINRVGRELIESNEVMAKNLDRIREEMRLDREVSRRGS
jgi:hypothetical protein